MFIVSEAARIMIGETFSISTHLDLIKLHGPIIFLSNKRYVSMAYSSSQDTCGEIECKGFNLFDYRASFFAKNLLFGALRHVLRDRNVKAAIKLYQKKTRELFEGNVDVKDLAISDVLSNQDFSRDFFKPPARVIAAQKMIRRGYSKPFKAGDTVRYVFVNDNDHSNFDQIENIDHAIKNRTVFNFKLYFEDQIKRPAKEIFDTILYPDEFKPENIYDAIQI
jgi:DNA polymerase elongation subunit (family B)